LFFDLLITIKNRGDMTMYRQLIVISAIITIALSGLVFGRNIIVNNTSNTTTINDSSSSVNTGIDLGSNKPHGIIGNGDIKTFKRKVTEFNKIIVDVPFDVNVECGKSPSVSVSSDSNIANLIFTEITGNTLIIKTVESFTTKNRINITVNADKLSSLDILSSGNTTISGITGNNFNLKLSGAGEVKLLGKIDEFDINSDGAPTLNAKDFKANTVIMVMNGAAEASVFASKKLDVKIHGAADVTYYGNPEKITENDIIAGSLEPGQ
jgi:hypothetical protein